MWETLIVEIICGIFSTFIGFFSALYLQRRTDRENENKRLILVIKSVSAELEDIGLSIKQYLDKDRVIRRDILTPNLDALMSSGMILEIVEKDIYPHFIDAFAMIKRLNDERDDISDEDRVSYMQEIVEHADNIMFLTKRYEKVKGKKTRNKKSRSK